MLVIALSGSKPTFRFEAREDKDEIVVEIWKLVELFQFLSVQLRSLTKKKI